MRIPSRCGRADGSWPTEDEPGRRATRHGRTDRIRPIPGSHADPVEDRGRPRTARRCRSQPGDGRPTPRPRGRSSYCIPIGKTPRMLQPPSEFPIGGPAPRVAGIGLRRAGRRRRPQNSRSDTPLGFGESPTGPARRGSPPGPGRPAIGRASGRPPRAAGPSPNPGRRRGGEVGFSQSRACSRHRAGDRSVGASSPGSPSVPASAAARAAWKRFIEARSAASVRRRGERLGPQAGRRRVLATREGEPGERRELLGVGRAVAPLHDGGEPRLQGDHPLGAGGQRGRGSGTGPAAGGRRRRGPGHRGPPGGRPPR